MKTQTKSRNKRAASTKRRVVKETRAAFAAKTLPRTSLELVTLDEAARAVGKTAHNIRDYIQRGRIVKYNSEGERITFARNGALRVALECDIIRTEKHLYLMIVCPYRFSFME